MLDHSSPSSLYRLHELAFRTQYAELKERSQAAGPLLPGTPGTLYERHGTGHSYWYRVYYSAPGHQTEEPFLELLKKTRLPFSAPGFPSHAPSTSAQLPGRDGLRVDVLVPGRQLGKGVRIPELDWHGQAVPHYDYLLDEPERGSLLAGSHCIETRLPQATRCVWHKLYASASRQGSPEKATKEGLGMRGQCPSDRGQSSNSSWPWADRHRQRWRSASVTQFTSAKRVAGLCLAAPGECEFGRLCAAPARPNMHTLFPATGSRGASQLHRYPALPHLS